MHVMVMPVVVPMMPTVPIDLLYVGTLSGGAVIERPDRRGCRRQRQPGDHGANGEPAQEHFCHQEPPSCRNGTKDSDSLRRLDGRTSRNR